MKTPKVMILAVAALVVLVVSLTGCNSEAQTPPAATITQVTKDTWQHEVLDSKLPVFVLFTSDNCTPCAQQTPIVEDLAKEYAGRVKFVKVDVVDQHDIRDSFNITRVPTQYVIKIDDKTAYYNEGFLDKPTMKKFIDDGLALKH